jgi:hypothetical protein
MSCAHVDLPADPKSTVNLLSDKSTPDQVIKAWVATAYAYREWNIIVRKQIEASR